MDDGEGGDEQMREVEWRADQRRRKELGWVTVGRGSGELGRRTGRAAGLCEVELCVVGWRLEIRLEFGREGVCQILTLYCAVRLIYEGVKMYVHG